MQSRADFYENDPVGKSVWAAISETEEALKGLDGRAWEQADNVGEALHLAYGPSVMVACWWGVDDPDDSDQVAEELVAWQGPLGWCVTSVVGEQGRFEGFVNAAWYERTTLTLDAVKGPLVGPAPTVGDLMRTVLVAARDWPGYATLLPPETLGAMLWGLLRLVPEAEQEPVQAWLGLAVPDLIPLMQGTVWNEGDPEVLLWPDPATS